MQTLQLLISGIAQGMIYALVAFGYNITFSTSKTLNFSLGNFLMIGGVIGFVLYMTRGNPFWATLAAVVAVGAVGGAILLKVAVEPSLRQRNAYGWILATLAVGIILRNAAEVFWSTDDFKFRSPLGDNPIRLFQVPLADGTVSAGLGVYPQELLIIGVSLAIVAGVEAFKRLTVFGKAVQAVSEDKDTASLMGIDQRFVILFSFMLSTAIACVGGVLVAPITLVSATMGTVLGVKAYSASIIGGLESGIGAVVGGLFLGISEALTARFVSTGYKDVPGFVVLILLLLFKPSGLFGRAVIRKVDAVSDAARPRPLYLRLAPLLLLLPLLLPKAIDNGYYVGLLNRILVYTILVASLDLVVGYIGDVSIGHAGLFAIGAYTVAVLTASPNLNTESTIQHFYQLPFLVALVPAVLLTAFAGFLLGFPRFESSGPYLAVITIVYGLIIYTFINEQELITNGTKGITLSTLHLGNLRLGGINYFYVVYPVLVLVMFVVHNVTHSFWGRAFEAIKYSGVAAESCGISRSYFKVAAFVLSAALAGLAGGFFAQLDAYVAPNTFAYNFSVEFLIALIFGGVRSVLGNLIGVGLIVTLPDLFNRFADYRLMVYGTLLLLVLYFMPEGVVGIGRRFWRRIRPVDHTAELAALDKAAAGVDVLSGLRQSEGPPALELKGVEMRFGGLRAVQDLSVTIPRGAVRGLIGPNGSGKSTTVNVLTGLYTPTAGTLVSFGENLAGLKPWQRARRGIARTFQNLQLFADLTVLENVMVGLHQSFRATLFEVAFRLPRARREEREARVRAYAFLKFVGLDRAAFDQARNLSYGQARHLEIARALALGPRLLLLDEPAAGLTSSEIEEINALVKRMKAAGVSILLIEHHMDMVMAISDEVTVLDFGKKIAEGRPAAVQSDPIVVEAYLGKHSTSTAVLA